MSLQKQSHSIYDFWLPIWWMSEWLLLSAKWAIFQLYLGENKLHFKWDNYDDDTHFVPALSWIFIVLKQQCVDISLHLNTLLHFLNAACLEERQNRWISSSLTWAKQVSNPRSTALYACTLTITPPMWFYPIGIFKLFLLTRRVPLVEQDLLTIPEHLASPPVFSGVCVTRSLVLYVYFVYHCLFVCTFSFGHCVDCSSSIYEFWLPFWYLQAIVMTYCNHCHCNKFNLKLQCLSLKMYSPLQRT